MTEREIIKGGHEIPENSRRKGGSAESRHSRNYMSYLKSCWFLLTLQRNLRIAR